MMPAARCSSAETSISASNPAVARIRYNSSRRTPSAASTSRSAKRYMRVNVLLLGSAHLSEPTLIPVDDSQRMLNFGEPEIEVRYLPSKLMAVKRREA